MPTSALLSLVILLSLGLTGYELFKIFGRDFGRTLRNRWTLLAGFLNIITATVVWLIIHNLLAVQPSILSALVTGLTFPALLRSRFTLYRSIGPAETEEVNELSLKMDQIYHDLSAPFIKKSTYRWRLLARLSPTNSGKISPPANWPTILTILLSPNGCRMNNANTSAN